MSEWWWTIDPSLSTATITLDSLIKHQDIILAFLGGGALLLVFQRFHEWFSLPILVPQADPNPLGELPPQLLIIPSLWKYRRLLLFVLGVILVFVSVYIFVHDRMPVPPTALLEFPPIEKRDPTHSRLLVFIHGWNGDPKKTWMKFPDLFEHDDRFKTIDRLVVRYPTYMERRNLNIAQLASWIVEQLQILKIESSYSKIAIVAHSMGGIVAREIILLEHIRETDRPYGLVLEIASPHNGADIAALGKVLHLSRPLADELGHDSSFLATLNTQWNAWMKRRPASYCYSSPLDQVVLAESAIFMCDHYQLHPQWGHTELVKPDDATDPRYSYPANQLDQFMNASVPLVSEDGPVPPPTKPLRVLSGGAASR